MPFRARTSLFALAILGALSLRGADAPPDPDKLKPEGYLSDFAHAVDAPSRDAITQYCADFERATGVQIAIVTIPTLGGEVIEDWSNKLFHNWGIGQKGSNEGVMLLLVVNDRKSRIEVGYGLEQYLTDGMVGGILRGIRPQLQAGSYGAALLQAAQQMGAAISKGKGVELANPDAYPDTGQRGFHTEPAIPFWLILLLIFAGLILLSKMGGGSGRGGGYRGGVGPMIWGGGLGGFGGFGGGGGGGWSGGGGGGGGGFGGFGGGDSGGGGASSGW